MKSLREQHSDVIAQVQALADGAKGREYTEEEVKQIGDLKSSGDELLIKIKAADEAQAQVKKMTMSAAKAFEAESGIPLPNGAPAGAPRTTRPGLHKSTERFRSTVNRAVAATSGRGGFGQKALIQTGGISFSFDALPVQAPDQSQFVAALLQQAPTDVPSGQYLREQAAPAVAATTVPMNTDKPILDLALVPKTWRLATVAVLSQPIPLQNFTDYEDLFHYVSDRLALNCMHALDTLVLTGGTDEDGGTFTGLLNDTEAQTIAYDADILTTVRDAIEALQIGFVEPTSIVVSPADWKALETASDTLGRPILNFSPTGETVRSAWGIPVTVTQSLPAGTALVGDLPDAATLLTRTYASLMTWHSGDAAVSTDAGTLFGRNQGQVRYEGRYALTVSQPSAYKIVSTTAPAAH